MTKAKARARAKARAGQKAKKHEPNADHSGPIVRQGQFDPQSSAIKGPVANPNTKNFAGAKSGAARAR
jgi:hypothetical protein